MVKIISSCLCLCSPVVVHSAMRQVVSHLVAVTNKALSTVFLVGRANGPYYCLLEQKLMALIFTDSSH
jgi:hypothetical protein